MVWIKKGQHTLEAGWNGKKITDFHSQIHLFSNPVPRIKDCYFMSLNPSHLNIPQAASLCFSANSLNTHKFMPHKAAPAWKAFTEETIISCFLWGLCETFYLFVLSTFFSKTCSQSQEVKTDILLKLMWFLTYAIGVLQCWCPNISVVLILATERKHRKHQFGQLTYGQATRSNRQLLSRWYNVRGLESQTPTHQPTHTSSLINYILFHFILFINLFTFRFSVLRNIITR